MRDLSRRAAGPARKRPFVIAIDGPAASGKGTLAARLADHYGFARLDTGKLYRAAARRLIAAGLNSANLDPANPDHVDRRAAVDAAAAITADELDDPALSLDDVARVASIIAADPDVRARLLAFQREFGANPPGGKPGAVIDGRDIGTVVCPEADVKLFVTASVEVRADRRLKELRERGETRIKADVLRDMRERDARDSARAAAPLKAAPDAFILDTSRLDADEAFEAARSAVEAKRD